MMLRFRSGVRVFWSSASTITVLSGETEHFSQPTHGQLQILHSLQLGIPSLNQNSQAAIVGVSPSEFESTIDRLRDFVISTESEPVDDGVNREIRSSEENRSELTWNTAGWQTSRRRKALQIRLSGISSAVWLAHQYFELAGVESVFSKRGHRLCMDEPRSSGWNLTHKLGFNPSRQLSLSIGFFFDAIDAEVHHYWISRGLPHIAVIFDGGGFRISRIVTPGATACLNCDPVMQPRGGVSKPILKSQASTAPIAYDDAATLALALSDLVQRVLDYADRGQEAQTQTAPKSISPSLWPGVSKTIPATNCGCLIDLIEPIDV